MQTIYSTTCSASTQPALIVREDKSLPLSDQKRESSSAAAFPDECRNCRFLYDRPSR
jgi:hypothetical protein